jgi:uncharacterized membrane protein YphA (DoxX/SURF4 family)
MKKKFTLVARILLGLLFFASGIVGLFKLAPVPPDLPQQLTTFNAGLEASVYFIPLLKLTESVCGLLLLSGFFVPLALVILAPVVLNIFFVNAFMMPQGLPLALIAGLLTLYLAFFAEPYKSVIRQLFKSK